MYEIIIICIFLFWYLLSILWQFKFKRLKWINQFDPFQLLPNWTFFAPNPGVSDFHLIYKIVSLNNLETPKWEEIPFVQHRQVLNSIWNPKRRYVKFLIDCINTLIITVTEYRKESLSENEITQRICLSVPYLLILNSVIKNCNQVNDDSFVQFAIIESYGFTPVEEPKPIIVSTFHKIK